MAETPPDPAPPASEPKSAAPPKLPEVVAFRNVTKSFGEGEEKKVAIEDVSFVVEDLPDKGELICIVGPGSTISVTAMRRTAGASSVSRLPSPFASMRK